MGSAPKEIEEFLFIVDRQSELTQPVELSALQVTVRDPRDNHVLATAVGGNVDFLVSGDADFLSLAGDPRLGHVRIVTAREFLDALPS